MNTTNTTNDPKQLPEMEAGEVSIDLAATALDVGISNWRRVKDKEEFKGTPYFQYDPFQGHRSSDTGHGFSRFRDGYCEGENPDLPGIGGTVVVEAGHDGWGLSRTFTVYRDDAPFCGEYATSCVPDGVVIKIATPHGNRLQGTVPAGTGDWSKADSSKPTSNWTFVLTYEGPAIGWMLASAYPGEPDATPCFDGLKVGDLISTDEARARNLRVKEVKPE